MPNSQKGFSLIIIFLLALTTIVVGFVLNEYLNKNSKKEVRYESESGFSLYYPVYLSRKNKQAIKSGNTITELQLKDGVIFGSSVDIWISVEIDNNEAYLNQTSLNKSDLVPDKLKDNAGVTTSHLNSIFGGAGLHYLHASVKFPSYYKDKKVLTFGCSENEASRDCDHIIPRVLSTIEFVDSESTSESIISSCNQRLKSGNFILKRDLKTDRDICLEISDLNNINIDCKGYSISAANSALNGTGPVIKIDRVKNSRISNCKIIAFSVTKKVGSSKDAFSYFPKSLIIKDSENVKYETNTIIGPLSFYNSINLSLKDNNITGFVELINVKQSLIS